MATKQDISDIKKIVQELRKSNLDLQLRVEDLEDRVATLEGGESSGRESSKPKEPEPILTCVQCVFEYKESENADGSCFYHPGTLAGHGWDFKYSCCNKGTKNYDTAKTIPGCMKGKHRSKHHCDYHYSRYVFYMQDQSKAAKEIWLEMDVEDLVTKTCEWAEVGLNNEGNLFILAGTSRIKYTSIAVYTVQELQDFEEQGTISAFNVSDPVGWNMKAELLVKDKKAIAVTVTIKPASSSTPLVKQVAITYSEQGDRLVSGRVQLISDPVIQNKEKQYPIQDEVKEGPSLDIGQDYSVDRKNDYQTEVTGDCPLKLQQHGVTTVDSSMRLVEGKWNNLFTCTVKVTNVSKEKLSISDAYGYYMNSEGEWVKCDDIFIGKELFRGNYDWFDTTNFWLSEGTTGSLQVRLCIKFTGNPPESQYDGRFAHPSLPQPLHLKFTFVDAHDNTASLRFEQGNKPLDLATREQRIENWCKKKEEKMLYWNFADDTDTRKRSDVAIYYSEDGIMSYRPALNSNASHTYYIDTERKAIGFQAKAQGQSEFLIEKWKKEDTKKDCSILPYGLVDLDTGVMYGLKMVVKTQTSKTTCSFLLPDTSIQGSLSVNPDKVIVKGDVKVHWSVSRASPNDSINVYTVNGKSRVTYAKCTDTTEGESTFKAPSVPGEYEVRYYPASLKGQYHGYRHDIYIASTKFSVVGAV